MKHETIQNRLKNVSKENHSSASQMSLLDTIQQRTGMDLRVFSRKHTWYAFGISLVLFSAIAWTALAVFGLTAAMFGVTDDAQLAPDFELETVNRTDVEMEYTNDTGWFRLSEHRGKVVILDFMARECTSCKSVQIHLEKNIPAWQAMDAENELIVIAIGSWYGEDLEYLNTSKDSYHVPEYLLGTGTTESVFLNGTTGERGDIRVAYNALAIPLVYVVDAEGYLVGKVSSGIPLGGWGDFDSSVMSAMAGDAEDLRFGLAEVDTSMLGIFIIGLFLSILVYFSPCAFPVLPSFVSYYLSLGTREQELIDAGRLKGRMPNSVVIGILAGLGMWTFFLLIGGLAAVMGEAFQRSGIVYDISLGIAILLLFLGFFMLTGGTSHLLGWVQRLVDRHSTTEQDESFTPRRNMYLYGIGYSAASIDCTAAAVLPFVIYLTTLEGPAVSTGLAGLMLGLLLLMVTVTVSVGLGRHVMLDFLQRATGVIKLVGSWMMMFAGLGLSLYITHPEWFS